MGVFLIFVVILVLSLILIGLGAYGDHFVSYGDVYKSKFKSFTYEYSEELLIAGVVLLIVAIIPMIILGAVAGIMTNNDEIKVEYAQEYDELISMTEEERDTLSYKARVEKYNNRIDRANQDINNYWIGWYVDRSVLNLPKIKVK